MRNLTLIITMLIALAGVSHASVETRGLRVVAKDPATGQSAEVNLYNKSYAVVIGIDSYKYLPRDRQLKNAVHDAKGVEEVLSKNFRFDKIIHLYNQEATKDRILEVLTEELPAQMGDQDSLFLFWAGHGDQEQGAQGKEIGYLIPYDGEIGKIRKNLTMTELRDTISSKLPAKHIFYVMDACYGGLLASTRAVDKKSRRDLSYLKEITKENVRQVLTAGGKGEEVLDGGPKGHSVFTGRLIEALEAAGDFITANEIQAILKEKVFGDSKGQGKIQTPAFGTLSGNGDYVFVPSNDYKLAEQQAKIDRDRQGLERQRADNEKLKKQMADDEAMMAAAVRAGDERARQVAELELKRKQGMLEVEKLKQKDREEQLRRDEQAAADLKNREAERQRIQEEAHRNQERLQEAETRKATEFTRLEQEQQKQKAEEERKNAELRRLGEEKRKKALDAFTATSSIEAAVEDIRKADAEIAGISRDVDAELERQKAGADRRLDEKKARHKAEYDKRMLEMKNQPTVSVTRPVIAPRDVEFEREAEYQARVKKAEADYQQRLAEARSVGGSAQQAEKDLYDKGVGQAEAEYSSEIAAIEQRISASREEAIKPFRERIAAIASKDYPVSPQSLKLTIGMYDPDKELFPVSISSSSSLVKFSVEGTLSLPRDRAKQFKQQYTNGLVRPEATTKTDGSAPVRVAMVNDGVKSDADGYLLELYCGEFVTAQIPYIDPNTRIMWTRYGNIACKEMNWQDAMEWIKTLSHAGYSDWRLPTKEELKAFAKLGGDSPSKWFNANGFKDVQDNSYWSSSTHYANESSGAWSVGMGYGLVINGSKASYSYVWPVRDTK
jgi:hypothetical protein